ncbi:N-acetylgalactosamine-6-sulfatase [candidate division KSB1 bacterium]|nr:arylsulfatase [candidate division KSB1 bacterium]RQW02019.1 MAG: N-acetylgalactosamine-6-sulfatase [candidate division KSB1 bacterium]
MKKIFLLFLICLLSCAPRPDHPPNIIYIMCDDLGYGDIGCYGQKIIQTPNIDFLAAEGIRFTDHYAGHTVCRPSRLVLWTGRHTGHTPISSNARYVFQSEDVTVAEILKEAAYITGGVGKWAMADADGNGHPNEHGFDFWMGYLDQSEAHNYYPLYLWQNREKVPLEGNVLFEKDEHNRGRVANKRVTYAHDMITQAALDFIRTNAHAPFLLHIHWTIPHANNEGGRVTGDGMEVPDYGIYAEKEWPTPEKGFAAMISRMDADVGKIMLLLKELHIDHKSVVFFTSDNGPHQEGGHQHEYFDSNGPLRGYKRDLYEGGIRVPLIVRWPGTVTPGAVSNHPSAFWDYLPTACDIARIKPPENIDGISYLSALRGEVQSQHEYLYWQFAGSGHDKQAVRVGFWKAVRPETNAPLELYDLSTDIGEQNNIASAHPDIVAKMSALILEAKKDKEEQSE